MSEKKYFPIEAIQDRYAISKSKIYLWISEGKFPAPVKLGRQSRWSDAALDAFDAKLENGEMAER